MRDQKRTFIRTDRQDFRHRRRLRDSFLGIVILMGGGNGWLSSPADAAEFFEGPMMARPEPVNRWTPPPQPMNRLGGLSEGAKIYQQPSPLFPRPSFGAAGKDLSSSARPVFSPPGKQPAYSASASRNNAEGTQPSVVRPVFPSDHSRPSLASRPEFGSTPPWRGASLGMSSQDQGRPEFVPPKQSTERALFKGNGLASEGQYARPGQPAPSTWSYHAPWASQRTTTQANLATNPAVITASHVNPSLHGMAFISPRFQLQPPSVQNAQSSLSRSPAGVNSTNSGTKSSPNNNFGALVVAPTSLLNTAPQRDVTISPKIPAPQVSLTASTSVATGTSSSRTGQASISTSISSTATSSTSSWGANAALPSFVPPQSLGSGTKSSPFTSGSIVTGTIPLSTHTNIPIQNPIQLPSPPAQSLVGITKTTGAVSLPQLPTPNQIGEIRNLSNDSANYNDSANNAVAVWNIFNNINTAAGAMATSTQGGVKITPSGVVVSNIDGSDAENINIEKPPAAISNLTASQPTSAVGIFGNIQRDTSGNSVSVTTTAKGTSATRPANNIIGAPCPTLSSCN